MPTTNLMPAGIALGGQLFKDAQRDFVFFINTKSRTFGNNAQAQGFLYDEVVHQLCSQSHGAK